MDCKLKTGGLEWQQNFYQAVDDMLLLQPFLQLEVIELALGNSLFKHNNQKTKFCKLQTAPSIQHKL
jgi:hypothetical protein